MTPEQLEEIPGIGEKTLEKISIAVRHYFGQYEEGEERPAAAAAAAVAVEPEEPVAGEPDEEHSPEQTPEEILAAEAGAGRAHEVRDVSAEDIAEAEEVDSESDANSDADAREEAIELDNDAVDSLVNESQESSDEGIDGGERN